VVESGSRRIRSSGERGRIRSSGSVEEVVVVEE
jgi:hypothetical protein